MPRKAVEFLEGERQKGVDWCQDNGGRGVVAVKDLFIGPRFELIVESEMSIRSRHVLLTMKTLGLVN